MQTGSSNRINHPNHVLRHKILPLCIHTRGKFNTNLAMKLDVLLNGSWNVFMLIVAQASRWRSHPNDVMA